MEPLFCWFYIKGRQPFFFRTKKEEEKICTESQIVFNCLALCGALAGGILRTCSCFKEQRTNIYKTALLIQFSTKQGHLIAIYNQRFSETTALSHELQGEMYIQNFSWHHSSNGITVGGLEFSSKPIKKNLANHLEATTVFKMQMCEQQSPFLVRPMSDHCYTRCVGFHSAFKSSSKYCTSPLKHFIAQGPGHLQDLLPLVVSAHLIRSSRAGVFQIPSFKCQSIRMRKFPSPFQGEAAPSSPKRYSVHSSGRLLKTSSAPGLVISVFVQPLPSF